MSQHPESTGPSAEPAAASDRQPIPGAVGVADLLAFVRRHWIWLVFLPLLGAATAALVSRLLPQKYEATATLLVSQLELESGIESGPLPIFGFQWILESPRVLRAAESYVATETGGEDVEFEVGRNAFTEMRTRRREQDALAPMIEVSVLADSEELAILMANAWTRAFIENLQELRNSELGTVVESLAGTLADAETELREVEAERATNLAEFEKGRATLAARWRDRIGQLLQSQEARLTEARQTTARSLDEALARYASVVEGLDAGARQALDRVVATRLRRAGTPERVVLIGSSPASQSLVVVNPSGDDSSYPEVLSFREELNPAFTALEAELIDAESDLLNRAGESPELRSLLLDVAAVELESSATRRSQEVLRFSELQLIERRHRLDEEALSREFELVDDQLARRETEAVAYRDSIAQRHREALVSDRAQAGLAPLRTVSEPTSSLAPVGRNLLPRIAIAAFAGLLIALGLGVVRDLG